MHSNAEKNVKKVSSQNSMIVKQQLIKIIIFDVAVLSKFNFKNMQRLIKNKYYNNTILYNSKWK